MSRRIPDDKADAALLRDLTAALDSGDADAVNTAFEAIYHACAGSVAFVCARFLDSDTDVQSVTDDVFVSFFQRAPYIEELDSLRAYLCQAARRASMDHLRARRRRERGLAMPVPLLAAETDTDPMTLIPDPDGDIPAHARYKALAEDLCATVGRENTEIILAHAVCGESFPRIARRLGKKENTVKTAYHRAIKRFRQEKGDRWL